MAVCIQHISKVIKRVFPLHRLQGCRAKALATSSDTHRRTRLFVHALAHEDEIQSHSARTTVSMLELVNPLHEDQTTECHTSFTLPMRVGNRCKASVHTFMCSSILQCASHKAQYCEIRRSVLTSILRMSDWEPGSQPESLLSSQKDNKCRTMKMPRPLNPLFFSKEKDSIPRELHMVMQPTSARECFFFLLTAPSRLGENLTKLGKSTANGPKCCMNYREPSATGIHSNGFADDQEVGTLW